jgi:hypothetical protein
MKVQMSAQEAKMLLNLCDREVRIGGASAAALIGPVSARLISGIELEAVASQQKQPTAKDAQSDN